MEIDSYTKYAMDFWCGYGSRHFTHVKKEDIDEVAVAFAIAV